MSPRRLLEEIILQGTTQGKIRFREVEDKRGKNPNLKESVIQHSETHRMHRMSSGNRKQTNLANAEVVQVTFSSTVTSLERSSLISPAKTGICFPSLSSRLRALGQGPCLLCSPLCSQQLEQGLAHYRCSGNIYQMNEWTKISCRRICRSSV